MSLAKAYCTVDEVKADIRNTSAATADIEAGILAASRYIDQHTGRDYWLHDFSTSALNLLGTDWRISMNLLLLPFAPIVELTRLEVNGVEWVVGTDFMVDGTSEIAFRLVPFGRLFPTGVGDLYSLTGKFGYAETSVGSGVHLVPDHIRRACVMIAAALCGHQRKDVVGLDGHSTTVADRDIPPAAKALLGPPHPRV